MLKEQIGRDLKQALLSGNKDIVTTLRGLKSAILYAEVAKGIRQEGLPDEEIIILLAKEAKKRQESADLFLKGGAEDRAAKELAEKEIIENYLPARLSDEALTDVVEATIEEIGESNASAMGKIIGLIKQKVGASADGARIAQLVKERLSKK
jgi:uncharacterized protein